MVNGLFDPPRPAGAATVAAGWASPPYRSDPPSVPTLQEVGIRSWLSRLFAAGWASPPYLSFSYYYLATSPYLCTFFDLIHFRACS